MNKDEDISSLAFITGKKIEDIIEKQTDNLQKRNRILEAKILQWYMESRDADFAEHFNIRTTRFGK